MRHFHQRDIATFASLICGFPGETRESVMNSLSFIEETAPTFFNVQLYYHDRRSPIHQQAAGFQIQGSGIFLAAPVNGLAGGNRVGEVYLE
jgi:hypothetical protein